MAQAIVGYKGLGPDFLNQFGFRNHPARSRSEVSQNFQALPPQRDDGAVLIPQFTRIKKKLVLAKPDLLMRFRKNFWLFSGHFGRPPLTYRSGCTF
ncbi:hypothetical protein [Roseovarius aestuarii]|uniref:hypothetical protein n=1 Tax=Roseovarius aestuarii TaxID=475083 RepID=UPI003672B5D4